MHLNIIAIGKRMPNWVETAFAEYAKRLPKNMLTLTELNLAPRHANSNIKQCKELEAKSILSACTSKNLRVALDVQGKLWSTEELAAQLTFWQKNGQNIDFIIGGPDGLSDNVLKKCPFQWSLSPLTLAHPVVRVVLIEQLYRAWTLLHNHPYHRAD